MHIIQSNQNPIIKTLKQIQEYNFRKKHNLSLIEGKKLVNAWIKSNPHDIECIIVSQNGLTNSNLNPSIFTHYKVQILANTLWKEITNLADNEVIALIKYHHHILFNKDSQFNQALNINNTCGIILDNIQDSGNMGNIIRTACAAGYDWLISLGGANLYSPKVLRSAMGGHINIKLYQVNYQLLTLLQQYLNENKLQIIATIADNTNSKNIENIYNLEIKKNHAWVIGSEGQGINSSWLNLNNSSSLVYIPQNPNLESLNASAAAALCLYEKVRRNLT